MSISSSDQANRTRRPRAVPDLPQESFDDREWDGRVAREVQHQEVIEASFDRAEAYARVGDFEQALEWLDRAATLSGGLPPAYRARRARWALSTAVRLRPKGGDQAAPGSRGLQGA
jgi:tetratricopeptide (TPR) repeat protein